MESGDVHKKETGGPESTTREVMVQFDRYVITVRLGPLNEFLGVSSVAIRQSFLSPKQKIQATGYHDVADIEEE